MLFGDPVVLSVDTYVVLYCFPYGVRAVLNHLHIDVLCGFSVCVCVVHLFTCVCSCAIDVSVGCVLVHYLIRSFVMC